MRSCQKDDVLTVRTGRRLDVCQTARPRRQLGDVSVAIELSRLGMESCDGRDGARFFLPTEQDRWELRSNVAASWAVGCRLLEAHLRASYHGLIRGDGTMGATSRDLIWLALSQGSCVLVVLEVEVERAGASWWLGLGTQTGLSPDGKPPRP